MPDDLGCRLVAEGQRTLIAVQQRQYFFRIPVYLDMCLFTDAERQLTVLPHMDHTGLNVPAEFHLAVKLLLGDQSGIKVIHRHKGAEIVTQLINSALHPVIHLIRAVCAQIFIDIHGGTEAVALVYIEEHQHLIPLLQLSALLLKGEQQILFQPPVQERADFSKLDYCEFRHFTHAELRLPRGSDQPVLRIPVDEDGKLIPHLASLRHLLHGQQHMLRCRLEGNGQIYAEFHFLYNDQLLFFSQSNHSRSFLSSVLDAAHPPAFTIHFFRAHSQPHNFCLNSDTKYGTPSSFRSATIALSSSLTT